LATDRGDDSLLVDGIGSSRTRPQIVESWNKRASHSERAMKITPSLRCNMTLQIYVYQRFLDV